MLDTLGLIKKPSHQALVDILNHNNNIAIQYNAVEFHGMTPLTGKSTQITISALPYPNGKPPFIGSKTFQYNRLDLNDFLDVSLRNMKFNLPVTTNELLGELEDHYDLYLNDDDFVIENINPGTTTYVLKAKPTSLRFINQVSIGISPADVPLNTVLMINVLNGLTLPSTEIALNLVYSDRVMDGLDALLKAASIPTLFDIQEMDGYWKIGEEGYEQTIPPKDDGLSLLNRLIQNHVPSIYWKSGDYTLSVPSTGNGTLNTSVILTGVETRGYIGSQTLYYNRFDLTSYFGPGILIYNLAVSSPITQILRMIESEFNIVLPDDEFDLTALPEGSYRVTAKTSSYGWTGHKDVIIASYETVDQGMDNWPEVL